MTTVCQPKSAGGPSERLLLDPTSPWWGEHRSRYRFAAAYVRGQRVLDIACGSGFGCRMLEESGAVKVVGVDIAASAVAGASTAFGAGACSFLVADGTALPFADGVFDLVTCFETIEHVRDFQGFVGELRRVCRRGGQLVLSTPNALVTASYPRNPYHVHEFAASELGALLARFYGKVELRGQHLASYYRVAPFLPGKERARTFLDRILLLLWKIGLRLPSWLRDPMALALTGRHFYPTEMDYRFEADLERAPVLVAVCEA